MRQIVFLYSVLILIQYFSIQNAEVTDELDNELLLQELDRRNVKRSPYDVPGYDRYPNRDYYGFDIQKFENTDRHSCAEECNELSECKAFVFNKINTCFIKTRGSTSGAPYMKNNFGELFIKRTDEIIGYTHYPKMDYNLHDIRKLVNSNPHDCADECNDEPKCKGIVFNIYTKYCYLKHDAKPEGEYFIKNHAGQLYIKDNIYDDDESSD
ncbi:DgyrCDS10692 [Dimorphilus gyrociliatus]|uniref:DgyrCDS10692 n=1 Tax=Dimorphilus gyrociliatus TaxID=2664684 RepID=A0A7I8W3I3_9ANNE|nr:DgyrCDS10692 [Dimorphilus gyrociliatus]